jgi:hypothetical protein
MEGEGWGCCESGFSYFQRIFGIQFNFLHISFGNPKIFRLGLIFSLKIKTGQHGICSWIVQKGIIKDT